MIPTNNIPQPTGEQSKLTECGFDLHRAYRAMIREILRRQLLNRAVSPATKEEPHA